MITVIQKGMNTILEANGYPELGIRIGIDIGENAIVQYGLRSVTVTTTTTTTKNQRDTDVKKINDVSDPDVIDEKKKSTIVIEKPRLDILGYTINIASKMTNFANPNQIIIGEEVYRNLNLQIKRKFKKLDIGSIEWNYINNSTGNTYGLFVSN